MWTYSQSTGVLTRDGKKIWTGYSGTGDGRNNPGMQDVPNVGPIPQGNYTIGAPYNDPHLGPCVMHLDPQQGTDDFGRSLFRMHGNNAENDASEGCVIMDHNTRVMVANGSDRELTVIP